MPAQPAIALSGVDVKYPSLDGRVREVFRALSLEITHGSFVSVLGPSGSGKSTLLRVIAGLLPAAAGEVHVFGRALKGPRDDVGFMFQRPSLFPWLDVLGNVTFASSYRHGRVSEDDRRRARDLLAMAGLADRERSMPGELSGGMQQRVALCRALFLQPRIVLLDEPFSALDETRRERLGLDVVNLLKTLGCTGLLVTHSVAEAVSLGDRIVLLAGSPAEVQLDQNVDRESEERVPADEHASLLGLATSLRGRMRALEAACG